jgi:thiamine-phosphate diphosphorylase
MTLPQMLVLTDRTLTGGRPLVDVVRSAVEGGATCVVLREKDLPSAPRAALASELRTFVPVLVVASDPTIDSHGVHLAAHDPFPSRARETSGGDDRLVGRSCHSRRDLDRAAGEGCTYATLSPIFTTTSKPGYEPPLGVLALRDPPLPVYALGGIDPSNAQACIETGAAGVAVMGAVMRADDPASVVKRLLP